MQVLTTATVTACAWAAPANSTFVTVSFDGMARVESLRDCSCLRTFTRRDVRAGGGVRVHGALDGPALFRIA